MSLQALPRGVELGKYRIIRTLGQGGFGITYLANEISTGKTVVIKENLPNFCACRDQINFWVRASMPNDPYGVYAKYREDFVKEARLLAKLHHTNIVQVLEAFEALGTAYYVMPWVGGLELHKAAPPADKIDESWLRPILVSLLGALEYLHARRVFHRDIKPNNILITNDNLPVVIDFGTARNISSGRSVTLVGSEGYAPIEQMTGNGETGPWTDVYALGATCYRLITGKLPCGATTRIAADQDPVRPLLAIPELEGRFSRNFLASIDKAMQLRAQNRWQSAGDWKNAVGSTSQAAEPVANAGTARKTSVPGRRLVISRWKTCCVCVVILLVILGGVYMEEVEEFVHTYESPLITLAVIGAFIAAVVYGQRSAGAKPAAQLPAASAQESLQELKNKELVDHQCSAMLTRMNIPPASYDMRILYAADNPELTKMLIVAGARVNQQDIDGWSPLYKAAKCNHVETVSFLLAAPDINVNLPDRKGNTPLHIAVYHDNSETVKALLEAPGIEISRRNSEGETPLRLAGKLGNFSCADLIRNAGGTE